MTFTTKIDILQKDVSQVPWIRTSIIKSLTYTVNFSDTFVYVNKFQADVYLNVHDIIVRPLANELKSHGPMSNFNGHICILLISYSLTLCLKCAK